MLGVTAQNARHVTRGGSPSEEGRGTNNIEVVVQARLPLPVLRIGEDRVEHEELHGHVLVAALWVGEGLLEAVIPIRVDPALLVVGVCDLSGDITAVVVVTCGDNSGSNP